MGARLASLSPAARTLLDTVAVLGTPVDSALLEAVAGLPPGAAAAGLRELSGRRVVREEPVAARVELDHPVLGRVAYALLSPSERQALHARAAAVLAARDLTSTAERSVLPYHRARGGAPRATPGAATAAPPVDVLPAGPDAARTPQRRTRRAARGAAVIVALATLTIGAVWGRGPAHGRARRAGAAGAAVPAADARRVLVGAFENRSGRADLDRLRDITTDWVVRGLDQTGLVEIVGAPAPAARGERGGTAVLADRLRAAARAAHAGTIVTGTLDQRGDTIVLEAMLVNADDGSVLRALSPVRTAAADPLAGVDRLRHEVVGALAARVDPRYDPGSDAHPPPSYAAYVALMRGDEAAASGASDRAVAEYRTAAAADSTYALPLLRIAMASFEGGQCGRVDSVANVLQRRGTPLSPFEGHTLERIRAFCRADWEAANDAARHMADLAPRSQRAQFAAAFSAASVNRPHEALRRLRRIDPTRGWTPPEGRYWIALAFTLHMAGDDAGLRALPGRMQGVQRDYFAVMGAAYAAAALGRTAEFERAAAELITVGRRMEATRLTILGPMLDELRAHGRPADAAAVAARLAAQVGAGVGPGAAGDTTRWAQAELLYRAGEWQAARALVAPVATRHPHIVPVVALAGRAAARTGDPAAARRAFDALGALSAPGTEGAESYGQAQIAALLGAREEAIRLLQRAVAQGVPYAPDLGTAYLGHADHDLEGVLAAPAIQQLLQRRG
jgi:TolB-like protein/tetratricopeptide (TPR) repeat protein